MDELAFEMQAPPYSLWGAWRRLVVAPDWTRPVVLRVHAHLRDPAGDEILLGQIRWQERPGSTIRIDVIDGGATRIIFEPKTLDPMVRFATTGPVRRNVVVEVGHKEVHPGEIHVSLAS
ncbi:MAG: hypothetical protein JWO51_4099 [Rhodospirillales bacterium]|nr:hypothetical protein [Rhodospirillales bacterium]